MTAEDAEANQAEVGAATRPRRFVLSGLLSLGLVGVAGAALIGALSPWLPWPGDLFAPFRLQYSMLFLVAIVVALVMRRRPTAVLAAALFVWQALSLVPLLASSDRGEPVGQPLRLLHANVLASNTDHDETAQWVAEQEADVILFQEATPQWGAAMAKALAGPSADWEVVETGTVQPGTYGIMLLVRSGLEVVDLDVDRGRLPSVAATIAIDGQELLIYSVHTVIPLFPGGVAIADLQVDAAAEAVLAHDGPAVIVGDLNATRWSPVYRRLNSQVELHDAADGGGLKGTWPNGLWFTGRIGIDHVLVTPEVCTFDRKLGPGNGSDHLPVVVDLTVSGCS